MQRLEVSCAVRLILTSFGAKVLTNRFNRVYTLVRKGFIKYNSNNFVFQGATYKSELAIYNSLSVSNVRHFPLSTYSLRLTQYRLDNQQKQCAPNMFFDKYMN